MACLDSGLDLPRITRDFLDLLGSSLESRGLLLPQPASWESRSWRGEGARDLDWGAREKDANSLGILVIISFSLRGRKLSLPGECGEHVSQPGHPDAGGMSGIVVVVVTQAEGEQQGLQQIVSIQHSLNLYTRVFFI